MFNISGCRVAVLVRSGLQAGCFRCIHTDPQLGFSVYRGDRRDDLILVASLPDAGQGEIAIRLDDPEPTLFIHYTDCFPDLVEDFVACWDSPKYKSRLVSIRHHDPDTIECLTEPSTSANGSQAGPPGNSSIGGGPPSVS
jgi:hypothetical protein